MNRNKSIIIAAVLVFAAFISVTVMGANELGILGNNDSNINTQVESGVYGGGCCAP